MRNSDFLYIRFTLASSQEEQVYWPALAQCSISMTTKNFGLSDALAFCLTGDKEMEHKAKKMG